MPLSKISSAAPGNHTATQSIKSLWWVSCKFQHTQGSESCKIWIDNDDAFHLICNHSPPVLLAKSDIKGTFGHKCSHPWLFNMQNVWEILFLNSLDFKRKVGGQSCNKRFWTFFFFTGPCCLHFTHIPSALDHLGIPIAEEKIWSQKTNCKSCNWNRFYCHDSTLAEWQTT